MSPRRRGTRGPGVGPRRRWSRSSRWSRWSRWSEAPMDGTPQELRGTEIKEAFRGYHGDEVDDMLERAAVTIENLTRQLQESPRPPAEAALAQVSRTGGETIPRPLLPARRAADDATAEAQERARQILDESE